MVLGEPGEKKNYCAFYYVLLGPCPAPPPPSFFIVAPSPTFILLSVFPNILPPLILSFLSPSIPLLSLSLRWITAGFRSLLAAGGNPIDSSRDSYHETITLIPPFLGRVWNIRPPRRPCVSSPRTTSLTLHPRVRCMLREDQFPLPFVIICL
ncbi:hypothetical protein BDV36DRAFT_267104 [Aspergillus pseudocaelatus]|uniref:Uncharacterized protein n=1 Tax=Aspergillus pseudocaelatus TaxID=1825620 RepID=A0ABQ6WBD9_9EURO|nr:hypothetical protein BDV36DRAFT_267104 [Aspergillus pseudocaelatus]